MTTERPAAAGFRLLKAGRLRLLTDAAGSIRPGREGHGLYAGDTRFACRLELSIGRARPVPAEPGSAPKAVIGLGTADRIELPGPAGIEVVRRRVLSDALAEEVRLAAGGGRRHRATIRLLIGFDAADIFEIRGYRRRVQGRLRPVQVDGPVLTFAYLGRDSRLRTLVVRFSPEPSRPILLGSARRGREQTATICWQVDLPPGTTTTLAWTLQPGERPNGERAGVGAGGSPKPVRGRHGLGSPALPGPLAIDVAGSPIQLVLDRALADLDLLAEPGPAPGERIIAAGLPWFAALFGRDSLLTAYEAIAFRPDLAVDALSVLAGYQARAGDRHGGEAGQILHELRTGEMARCCEVPFGPSFGSVDATPLWLVLLGEADDWLADPRLVGRLWPAATRALDWLDQRTARDPDGFLRYAGRPGALANEGWKDSPDSVRDRTGAIVPPPIALAEVQGYAFDARRRLARLARLAGQDALADRLDREASRLRARFNAAFWVADRGVPAMAIGRDGQLADAVASNAGQCLWSGILDRRAAAAVAGRIQAADIDSGWGLRTVSAAEPAFDPLGYHTGSVWPHDSALIAGGLKRAGFDDAALRLADELFAAALALPDQRLPELLSGEARQPGAAPARVEGACPVQAWASAAPLHLVRSLLGLEAHAREGRLVLRRPRLPSGVDLLRVRGLPIGSARIDVEVSRGRAGVRARLVGGSGAIGLVRAG